MVGRSVRVAQILLNSVRYAEVTDVSLVALSEKVIQSSYFSTKNIDEAEAQNRCFLWLGLSFPILFLDGIPLSSRAKAPHVPGKNMC